MPTGSCGIMEQGKKGGNRGRNRSGNSGGRAGKSRGSSRVTITQKVGKGGVGIGHL